MSETTNTEFLDWQVFLKEEQKRTTKQDYYLARIAKEVYCSRMKADSASKVKLKDFILSFEEEERKPKTKEDVAYIKNRWFLGVGLVKNRTARKPRRPKKR